MPRVIKPYAQNILPEAEAYCFEDSQDEFSSGIKDIINENTINMHTENAEVKKQIDDAIADAKNEAREIANQIILDAREEALNKIESARAQGYEEGFKQGKDNGYEEGFKISKSEAVIAVSLKYDELLYDLKTTIDAINDEKSRFITQNKTKLTSLAITVAEKVIDVSLSTSSEVIERMMTRVIDESKNNEKVKIYISDFQAELITKIDKNLLEIIENTSNNIKIEVLKDAHSGTCIVEFPDKIIDASSKTQIDNIREHILI